MSNTIEQDLYKQAMYRTMLEYRCDLLEIKVRYAIDQRGIAVPFDHVVTGKYCTTNKLPYESINN